MYRESIQLPTGGTTVRYPFDTHELRLGLANPFVDQAGNEVPPPRLAGNAFISCGVLPPLRL